MLVLFMIGGLLLFSSIGSLIVLLIYHTPSTLEASDPVTAIRISQAFASIGTFLLPVLLFAYCQNRQCFQYNAANRKPEFSMTIIVLILSVTLLPIVSTLSTFNIRIMPQEGTVAEFLRDLEDTANYFLEMVTSRRSTWDLVANILAFAVLAGLCEEFFFQGALQPLMTKWTRNPHVGILITAFIFSTLHLQFYGFIPRFALGVYLGYLFYWSRSIWLPVVAHVMHNALAILTDYALQGRGIDTDNLEFTELHGAIPIIISCTLVSAMGIVFLWRTFRDSEANKLSSSQDHPHQTNVE